MSLFRRVEQNDAAPTALGLLIPPTNPTTLIVRPRSLSFDLLPAKWTGRAEEAPQFCRLARDEAATLARRLLAALDEAVMRGICPVETFGRGALFQVWVRAADYFWIACRRAVGVGYTSLAFSTLAQAAEVGEQLVPFVWPAADVAQPYYVNTQKFEDDPPHGSAS